MQIKSIKHVYKNGLRLILVPQKDSPSVTVAIMVEAGSTYETEKNNGLSHFLEHMCFKGTTKRPRPIDIASELEGLGASYNAFTSKDVTGYYAKVAYPNFEHALEILSDMYQNPVFSTDEINKEKGVIIEEINMYEDQPRAKVSQVLDRLMYGNQPAGWDIAGTKENIMRIGREDFIKYRKEHYHASKTIVVVAGNIDVSKSKNLVKKYFSNIPSGSRIKPKKVVENQKSSKVSIAKKPLDQTHFAIGIKTFPILSDKKYPLFLLSEILGGGMSSRLFQKVREELGAAYYIGSSTSLFVTHGYLEISAGVNHKKAKIAINAIMSELKDIIKNGITDKELKRVKDHKIGTFLLSLETSSDQAFYFAEQEVSLGKMFSPDEVIKKINSVTKSDIARLTKEIMDNRSLNLAVVGPYSNTEEFKKLFKI